VVLSVETIELGGVENEKIKNIGSKLFILTHV
jgi:hypothetical protein